MWIELYHFIEFWCVIKTMARSGEVLLKGYDIYFTAVIQMNQYAIPTMCSNL